MLYLLRRIFVTSRAPRAASGVVILDDAALFFPSVNWSDACKGSAPSSPVALRKDNESLMLGAYERARGADALHLACTRAWSRR